MTPMLFADGKGFKPSLSRFESLDPIFIPPHPRHRASVLVGFCFNLLFLSQVVSSLEKKNADSKCLYVHPLPMISDAIFGTQLIMGRRCVCRQFLHAFVPYRPLIIWRRQDEVSIIVSILLFHLVCKHEGVYSHILKSKYSNLSRNATISRC